MWEQRVFLGLVAVCHSDSQDSEMAPGVSTILQWDPSLHVSCQVFPLPVVYRLWLLTPLPAHQCESAGCSMVWCSAVGLSHQPGGARNIATRLTELILAPPVPAIVFDTS